jgi:lipopolysaccharide export system permease protein
VSILDAYILRKIMKPLLFVFLAFVSIFVLVDLFDHAHTFIDNNVKPEIVIKYYLYYMPMIVVLTAPVAMLLATLLSLGGLSRKNEVMAMKGSGVSLYRIAAPILLLAVAVSVGSLVVGEIYLPPATRARLQIKEDYLQRRARQSVRTDVIYVRPDGAMLFARRFNVKTRVLDDVTVEEFDRDLNPTRRIDAVTARWEGRRWLFEDGRIREFSEAGERATAFATFELPYDEPTPEDLETRKLQPEEMGYRDLRAYVMKLQASGNDARRLAVQLQLKTAFPFVTLIMTLIGAPLAAGARRSGFALAFTAALAISFIYYGLINVGTVLGTQGVLPAPLAAWIANIAFAGVGFWLLVKAPK